MSDEKPGFRRRKFLVFTTTAVGGVAAVGAAVPFVMSMMPSEGARAAGAPVEVDIGGIRLGTLVTFEWRRKPIWVVYRTGEMLDLLGKHDDKLLDPRSEQPQQPEYAKSATRSIKPRIFCRDRHMYSPWLCTDLSQRGGGSRLGYGLAGRLFLSLPRFKI